MTGMCQIQGTDLGRNSFEAVQHSWESMQLCMQATQMRQMEYYDLMQRLGYVCQCISAQYGAGSVCVFQPWLTCSHEDAQQPAENKLFASPMLGLDGGAGFQEFRHRSCMSPLGQRNSMPGRVWRTGALQVVQSLRIIPKGLHPRSKLADEYMAKVAEALYIPVYDSLRPSKGAVSVLEVFLASKAAESMLVADFISYVSSSLEAVRLSLSNPQPQPVTRSALCGRRSRGPKGAQAGEHFDSSSQAEPPSTRQGSEPAELGEEKRLQNIAAPMDASCQVLSSSGADTHMADESCPQKLSCPNVTFNMDSGIADSAAGSGTQRVDAWRQKMRKTAVPGILRSKSMHTMNSALAGQASS